MADGAGIKVIGLDDLKSMFDTLDNDQEIRKVIRPAVAKAGARLRTYMRRRAPKGNGPHAGELRKSIYMKRGKYTEGNKVWVGLLTRQYYSVLDVGRKAYKRKTGKEYSATPAFASEGVGIMESYEAHKEEIAQMIVDQIKINIAKIWGKKAGEQLDFEDEDYGR